MAIPFFSNRAIFESLCDLTKLWEKGCCVSKTSREGEGLSLLLANQHQEKFCQLTIQFGKLASLVVFKKMYFVCQGEI